MTASSGTDNPVRVWSVLLHSVDSATLVPVTAQLDTAAAPCTSGISREARDRVRAAICNGGYRFPSGRLALSAPIPSLPLSRPGLMDLAVAVAIVATSGAIPAGVLADTVFVGQLGLDGRICGDIGLDEVVRVVRQAGLRRVVVPSVNARWLSRIAEVEVFAAPSLAAVLSWAADPRRDCPADPPVPKQRRLVVMPADPDIRDAVQVCAAGGHHLAVAGAEGAPTEVPVQYLHALLPSLSRRDALDLVRLRGRGGVECFSPPTQIPPLRELPHSASWRTVFGTPDAAGAAVLADQGVLACTEFPHMDFRVRTALAILAREGAVRVGGNADSAIPARFQLALTGNDCPCEGSGAQRVSGPHVCFRWPRDELDACVDVRVRVQPGQAETCSRARLPGRKAVLAARRTAARRWSGLGMYSNARVPADALRGALGVDSLPVREADRLTATGVLTPEQATAVLAVAWTLCDLREAPAPTMQDFEHALQLRRSL